MKYKLLAVDMDGTLLNDDSLMTERTKSAVLSLANKGVLFVPSTGRPMRGLQFLNKIFPDDFPCVIFNGAMVVTAKSQRVLFAKNLDEASVKEIFTTGKSHNISVIMWIGERLFVSRDCEDTRAYRGITKADMHIVDDIDDIASQGVTKMLWILTPDDAIKYQTEMREHLGDRVNCHTSRPYLLEFVDAGASKALALKEIGNIYNIDKSEMIAVGDGYNDASMLEYAGLGVAMENAPEDIKKLCQYVTLSNNHDGVAAVINKFII